MGKISVWIRELRAPFFTCTLVPVLLGTAVAWYYTGSFNLIFFLLALIGITAIHAGANMIDDYFDYKSGCDTNPIYDELDSPFFGGSRMLAEGKLKPKEVYIASIIAFAIGSLIGLYFVYSTGWPVLLLGAIGMFFAYFHVTHVCKWGLAEFSLFFNFGPLITLGAYYVQTQQIAVEPLVASMPIGLIMACMLLINQIPDKKADEVSDKNTVAVTHGEKTAAEVFMNLFFIAFLFIPAAVLLSIMPWCALIALLAFPDAKKAMRIAVENYGNPQEITLANAITYKVHLVTGLLLTSAYLLAPYCEMLV